jgi:predicted RecA/RadA family phage recombinase
MSNTMRWRYGETNPVVLPVSSATVIEIGDLVYFDSGTNTVKPAGALTYGASLAATQDSFHDKFAGVAMQQSRNGDTQDIRVATTGVFEFVCASATFEVGARIGVDKNAGATALLNQQVIGTAAANPELSIGYCARRVNPAGSGVLVDVVGSLTHAGPQAIL